MKLKPVIKLHSGLYFNFVDLEKNYVLIEDIAYALAHLNRFTGHRGSYSVAEHSIMVSKIVPPEYAMEGLLHDAAEFVMNDLSSPLKQLLPDYCALSKSIEGYLARVFKLRYPFPPCVKQADHIALATEVRDLGRDNDPIMNQPHDLDDTWDIIRNVTPRPEIICPTFPYVAYQHFIDRFYEICHEKTT